MFCQNCGKQINEGAAFCPYCGAKCEPFSAPAAPVQEAQSVQTPVAQPVQAPVAQPVQAPVYTQAPVYAQPAGQGVASAYPAAPAKKKSKAGMVIGIILGVIAFFVIIGVVASSGNKYEKKFYGEWATTMDLSDEIVKNMGDSGKYMSDFSFELQYTFIFNKDGTYKVVADEDSFNENMVTYKQALKKAAIAAVRDAGGSALSNYTDEQIIKLIENYYEKDFDTYIDDTIGNLTYESFAEDTGSEGKYKVDKDKFYLSSGTEYEVDEDVYAVYTMPNDDTIIITDYISAGETDESMFPLPLTLEKAD